MRLSADGTDVVTYVLVVTKELKNDENFLPFVSAIMDTAARLNDDKALGAVLRDRKKVASEQTGLVTSMAVRFIPPQIERISNSGY
jgi:hypothetical protein